MDASTKTIMVVTLTSDECKALIMRSIISAYSLKDATFKDFEVLEKNGEFTGLRVNIDLIQHSAVQGEL